MDTQARSDAALLDALFRIVAAHGWRGVTVARLSDASDVPGADLANFAGYVVWTAWCVVLGVRLARTGLPGRPRGAEVPALSELHA